jgi:hypothetical protein
MSQNKSPLHEVATNSDAVKTARSEPIQQETAPKQSMDFIRSLVLDIHDQADRPVSEGLNLEKMLGIQLEAEARRIGKEQDPIDHVSFDIPTLIRVFELVREGIKSDVELHNLVERIVALKDQGVLTMQNYSDIAGGNPDGTTREKDSITSLPVAGDHQNESLDLIKKLAGIR